MDPFPYADQERNASRRDHRIQSALKEQSSRYYHYHAADEEPYKECRGNDDREENDHCRAFRTRERIDDVKQPYEKAAGCDAVDRLREYSVRPSELHGADLLVLAGSVIVRLLRVSEDVIINIRKSRFAVVDHIVADVHAHIQRGSHPGKGIRIVNADHRREQTDHHKQPVVFFQHTTGAFLHLFKIHFILPDKYP